MSSIQRSPRLPHANVTAEEERMAGGGSSGTCILLMLTDITAPPVKMAEYMLGELLGKGAFGSVYLGKKVSTGASLVREDRVAHVADVADSVTDVYPRSHLHTVTVLHTPTITSALYTAIKCSAINYSCNNVMR